MTRAHSDTEDDDPTTVMVRRTVAGDVEGLAWVVRRFTPALEAQARYRLGPVLAAKIDPDDLIQDVWMITIPRLGDIRPRDGRFTPVLLKFLSSVLLRRSNALLRDWLRHGATSVESVEEEPKSAASIRDVFGGVALDEEKTAVREAVEKLPENDREVVILRGLEQRPNGDVAKLLGLEPNTVAQRYRRALQRLRELLPGSILDEID